MLCVTVERPVYGGLSIARLNGETLFVRGAVPGETVEVEIEEKKKDYSFCSTTRILSPSTDRVKPFCPYFGVCGGCQLQYISYNRQISLKEETLLECVRRLAGVEISLYPSFFEEIPWNYRHRGQFKISGKFIGFFREKTRDIIDIAECPLMADEVNNLLSRTSELLRSDKNLIQSVSELHITHGDIGIALLKLSKNDLIKNAVRLAQAMLDSGFEGALIEPRHKESLYYGTRRVTFDLNGLSYSISPQTFFQSHWKLNRRIVDFVLSELRPLAGKKIVDLYAGAGNFALPLALEAKEVIAVEENAYAVADGILNAKINSIENCRFIKSSAEDFSEIAKADIFIIDPPRPGLTNVVINNLLKISPERIVYISCNPSTFARDLKKLIAKYELKSLRLIDFFPQTYHIESIAFLEPL